MCKRKCFFFSLFLRCNKFYFFFLFLGIQKHPSHPQWHHHKSSYILARIHTCAPDSKQIELYAVFSTNYCPSATYRERERVTMVSQHAFHVLYPYIVKFNARQVTSNKTINNSCQEKKKYILPKIYVKSFSQSARAV